MKIEELAQEVEELRKQVASLAEKLETPPIKEKEREPKHRGEAGEEDVPVEGILGALEKELQKCKPMEDRKGAILYAGLIKGEDGIARSEWISLGTMDELLSCPPARVSRFLSPFSSEQRVAILRALFPNRKGINELEQATGLTSGQIYHHIKELQLLEYIKLERRNVYSLSGRGMMVLFTLLALTHRLGRPTAEEIEEMLKSESQGKES